MIESLRLTRGREERRETETLLELERRILLLSLSISHSEAVVAIDAWSFSRNEN